MGFFSDVLKGMGEAAVNDMKRRFATMPKDELQAKWDETFKNKPANADMYQPDSYNDILDEAYKNRISYKNWKYKHDQEQERIQRQRWEREREIREAQEAQIRQAAFKNSLSSNEMVKQIISKINNLGYEAFSVCVYEDEVAAFDEKEKEILSIKYVRFGYPKLEDQQIEDFTEYLRNNLKLKYEINEDGDLELNDAPGGMKKSW